MILTIVYCVDRGWCKRQERKITPAVLGGDYFLVCFSYLLFTAVTVITIAVTVLTLQVILQYKSNDATDDWSN